MILLQQLTSNFQRSRYCLTYNTVEVTYNLGIQGPEHDELQERTHFPPVLLLPLDNLRNPVTINIKEEKDHQL